MADEWAPEIQRALDHYTETGEWAPALGPPGPPVAVVGHFRGFLVRGGRLVEISHVEATGDLMTTVRHV